MPALPTEPPFKVEARDEGGGWTWVVSECGWPPLSGRAPSPSSAQRTAAFASSVAQAFDRIGRRRF